MERTKWIDRTFTFDAPEGWLPNILERLRGTPVRLRSIVALLPEDQLVQKEGIRWSIKEHIGHLSDLEDLHEGRIDDFLLKATALRPADMSNMRTESARHNNVPLEVLLENFRHKRLQFVERLGSLDPLTHAHKAVHPRLKILMRPIDMASFTAEHDDHHLASIRELIRNRPGME